jgi:hypothetical protein
MTPRAQRLIRGRYCRELYVLTRCSADATVDCFGKSWKTLEVPANAGVSEVTAEGPALAQPIPRVLPSVTAGRRLLGRHQTK